MIFNIVKQSFNIDCVDRHNVSCTIVNGTHVVVTKSDGCAYAIFATLLAALAECGYQGDAMPVFAVGTDGLVPVDKDGYWSGHCTPYTISRFGIAMYPGGGA